MNSVITGGAGFIGSHLADALVARGERVTIVDDFSTGRRENIEHLFATGMVELVEASVCDPNLMCDVLADADRCFHLASAVGVQLIVDNPLESMQQNVHGMQSVIDAASRTRTRLLLASTSEIYGKSSTEALREDSDRILGAPTKARWSYANAKVYGEMLAYGYHRERGAENIVVRFFNTVGPRQSGMYGMVVPSFVRQALSGDDITVFGDGSQSRCFTHVQDSVDAILRLVDCDAAIGRPFNVGSPTEVTINELANEVRRLSGSKSGIRHVPYDVAYGDGFEELGRRMPDATAIWELTGWKARHSIEGAINDIVSYETTRVPQPAALLA